MKILVTGVTGFVGGAFAKNCESDVDLEVIGVGRKPGPLVRVVRDIDSQTDWSGCLDDIDVVMHCAAKAHVMASESRAELDVYREVNTLGALNLARAANAAGIKRFIFISSIKAMGEYTYPNRPFRAMDECAPEDAYGHSKKEAEEQLLAFAAEPEVEMEVVIIRPTLVYGPGVKGNFNSLIRLVVRGLPLPFASLSSPRSMISISNLVDLMKVTLRADNAANKVFLVSDDDDVSMARLLHLIRQSSGSRSMLIPFPMCFVLRTMAKLGYPKLYDRLCRSLQVDISETKAILGWQPIAKVEAEVKATVDSFITQS